MIMVFIVSICSQSISLVVARIPWYSRHRSDILQVCIILTVTIQSSAILLLQRGAVRYCGVVPGRHGLRALAL
jgi:hypothetical protein